MAQKFLSKIDASAGLQFTGGSIAQATAVLHTNNVIYFRGGSSGLILSNGDGTDLMYITTSDIRWEVGSAEKMRLNSNQLLLNATSSSMSNDKLYINGDGYTTGGWRTGTSSTYVGKLTNSSGILTLQSDTNRDIQFGDAGTVAIMYIDTSTEKVGIGTVTPTKNLSIYSASDTRVDIIANNAAGDASLDLLNTADGKGWRAVHKNNQDFKLQYASSLSSGEIGSTSDALTINSSLNATFVGDLSSDTFSTSNTATFGSDARLQADLSTLNKGQTAYIDIATRDTSGSEVVYNLSNVGSITTDAVIIDKLGTHGRIRAGGSMFLGGGSTTTLVQFSADAIPDSTNSHDLGSSTRYWGSAYINTITTTGDISVVGTGNATIIIDSDSDNSGAAGSYLTFRDNGATKWVLYKETNNDFYLYNPGASKYPMHFQASGDLKLLEDGNDLIVGTLSSGNTSTLTVNHEGGTSAVASFKSRTNRAQVLIGDNDTNGYLVAEGGIFGVGRVASLSANNININASHNVGIGTTAPDAKLSVTSTGIASEDVLYLKSGADNADEYLGIAFETGGGGNGPHGAIRVYNGPSSQDAYMSFLTTTNGGTLTQGLILDHLGNATFPGVINWGNSRGTLHWGSDRAIIRGQSGYVLELQSNGGTTALVLDNSANATFSGTVGVGIAAPTSTYQLRVDGHTLISSEKYHYFGGSNTGIGTDSSNNLVLRQNGADLMTTSGSDVTFAGNVRINKATNPNLQLYRSDATTQLWELSIDSSGRLLFQEAASSGGTQYTRFQIDDTGESTFYGKVEVQNNALQVRDTSSNLQLTMQASVGGTSRIMAHNNNLGSNHDLDIVSTQIDLQTGSISGSDNSSALLLDSSRNATFAGVWIYGNRAEFIPETGGYDQLKIANVSTDDTNKLAGIYTLNYTNNNTSIMQYSGNSGANNVYYGSADGNYRGITAHRFYVNASPTATSGHTQALVIAGDTSATFSGNVTVSGNLSVTGTTTTVNQTNLDISDNIIGLNRGASSNANDAGLIIERGSTGDNATILWDESIDHFVFGLTTALPSATGNVALSTFIPVKTGALQVNGNITGITGRNIVFDENNNNYIYALAGSSSKIQLMATHSLVFATSASQTTALTLDGSQNATFTKDVTLSVGKINMPNNKAITWTGGSIRAESSILKLVGDNGIQLQDNTSITGALDITGNLTMSGAQILTTAGQNLGLNPNTGIVSVGGVIQASGTGTNTFAGNIDVNGTQITFGGADSRLAENQLRFNSAGAAYIDHGTTSQSIKFRLSSSSVLDVIPLEITPSYLAVTGNVNIPSGYVGRDSHNYISFSTDNQLIFRIADSHRFKMISDSFHPYTDSTFDLGTSTYRFRNLYADTLYGDGSNLTGIVPGIPNPLTTNIYFNNSVRSIVWPHTSGQSASRAYAWVGEQGAYGRFGLRSSNAADDTIDTDVLYFQSGNATFAGDVTIPDNLKATGGNLKLWAGGTHVFNVDVNRNIYPQTHNSTDIGFSSTLAFRDFYLSGTIHSTGGGVNFSAASDITFPDNLGAALEFKEGSNLYMRFVTTNGSEAIQMEKATTISNTLNVSGNITALAVGNTFNGHIYYNAYDTQGQHYPHFRDGSANNGADVNWRMYYGSSYRTHQWKVDSSGNTETIFNNGKLVVNRGNNTVFTTDASDDYARFTHDGGSAQLGLFRAGSSAGGFHIGGDVSKFRIYTSGFAERFSLDTSGNGIFVGDVTVGDDLVVTGNSAWVKGNTPVLTLGVSNTSTGNAKLQFYSKNTNGNSYALQYNKTTSVDRLEFIDGSGNPNIYFNNGGSAYFASDVTVVGNLNITGDINTTTVTDLDVTDKTITVAAGAADSAAADGAGLIVDGASASLLYDHTGTQWEFNKNVEITGDIFVAENIGHAGDTDTKIQFDTNRLLLKAGGATHLDCTSSQQTVLYSGNATALTLDTSQNATFAGKVAIGGASQVTNSGVLDVQLDQTNGTLGAANTAHFGKHGANTSGQISGITLGYKENGNASYRKLAIVSEGRGDGAARQNLHLLVNTQNGSNSASLADSALKLDGLTRAATFAGNINMTNTGSGDETLTIKSTTGGDPSIVFNSAAANRNGSIRFQDNGTQMGEIRYVHNGDALEFHTGGASGSSHQELKLKESEGATFRTSVTSGDSTHGRTLNGSKSVTLAENTYTDVLTVSMANHTGCYVKIFVTGDWNSHSAVQYLGEYFLTNGAGDSYNEPGMIIREVDNTKSDTIVAKLVDPSGTSGNRDFKIQLLADDTVGSNGFSAKITYEVMGQYVSVS